MTARGLFVAGTDTGAGKTAVAAGLLRALARRGLRVAGMKPVAAGAEAGEAGLRNADALALSAAANVRVPYELVNPYCFRPSVSPHLAAAEVGQTIDPGVIRGCFETLCTHADLVVVEGAGGWLSPIGPRSTMEDVATTLGLPVLLVVGLRLGCLSHALLTARAAESRGLALCGWVGNHIDPTYERSPENLATLQAWLGREALATVPFMARPEREYVFSEASAGALACALGR